MFLSDPPASDLAKTLYDEDRESDGYVMNTTRLLADWARRVAIDPGGSSPADISRLHDAGLTDQQIFEATVLIAWRMAFTAVNAALGAQPDAQLAGAAPAEVRAAVSYGRPPAGTLSA